MSLTNKQEKFIQGLLSGLSQREAYKQAYDASRMKDKTIDEVASRLLKQDKINARYSKLKQEVLNKIAKKGLINAERIISEIASIAFDDISNYLEYKTVAINTGEVDDEGKPIVDYDTIVELKDSKTINTKNIAEVSKGRDGQFKFKLYAKDTALYKLADFAGISKSDFDKYIANERLKLEMRKVALLEKQAQELDDDIIYEIEEDGEN